MKRRLSLYRRWRRFRVLSLAYPLAECAACGVGTVAIWWVATYG